MNGNTHHPHPCPFCWRVLYSKGALTNHLNNEHWDMKEEDETLARPAFRLGLLGESHGSSVVEVDNEHWKELEEESGDE